MKKFFIFVVFLASFILATLTVSYGNTNCFSKTKIVSNVFKNQVQEEWREYVLIGDQWYLVIHFDDGTIGYIPIAKPPED